jgi:hypothetical protein
MIYTRTGKLKYNKTLIEILEEGKDIPYTQHDRKIGDNQYKFLNCDFTNQDFSGMKFDGLILDKADFTGCNLKGTTFFKCGLRSAIFKRCQLDGAKFINCNIREGVISESFADEITLYSCNLVQIDMQRLQAPRAHIEGNDMRKANVRSSEFSSSFFAKNKMRGMITRNATFSWSNAPRFFHDEALQYDYLDPETEIVAYKLCAADARGIYHPKITYEVGKTFDAEDQDGVHVPLDPRNNTGMAVANMAWVLREWVACGAYGDYRLFQVTFKVKDIMENEGAAKFNIKKMDIIKEIDMAEFYELMTESIDYHTGVTAVDTEV